MSETSKNVGDLKAALAELPDDLPVLLSSDEEGNGFHHLWDVEVSKYNPTDDEPVHPDDVEVYEPEELVDVVVLWP